MDLAAHFRVIAQNWLRILLISVGIAVLVFAASTVQSKEYQAKAQLEVVPGNAATNGQTLADASTYLAQNYAQYAKTPTVVRNAIKTSGMKLTVEQATNRISASQVGDLGFVEVKATGPNRADAERLTRFAGGVARLHDPGAADGGEVRRPAAGPDRPQPGADPAQRTAAGRPRPGRAAGSDRRVQPGRDRHPEPQGRQPRHDLRRASRVTARSRPCRCGTPSWRSSSPWSSWPS